MKSAKRFCRIQELIAITSLAVKVPLAATPVAALAATIRLLIPSAAAIPPRMFPPRFAPANPVSLPIASTI